MQLPGTYRHELKYPINEADYHALRRRLSPLMRHDVHAGREGLYTVRSIYFDNADDKALREKSTMCRSGRNSGYAIITTT